MGKLRNLSEYTNKTKLNPKIFDGEVLKKKLRIVLLKIAKQFYKELDVNIPIEDVTLTGSSANYNWTPTSDIDLHIILDTKKAKDPETAKKYFTTAKEVFSNKYDLKYGGNPIEVYVQDKNEPHHSTGVFSIKKNKWVKKPSYTKVEVSDLEIKKKVDPIKKSIDEVDPTKPGSIKKLDKIRDRIKAFRQAGLEKAGEYSVENLAFKELRNNGSLEKLANKRIEARKAEMGDGILKEFVTQQEIQNLEQGLDKLYQALGVDVEFTKHFIDRVNDERNKKPITSSELEKIFKDVYSTYGHTLTKLGPDAEAVMKDMETDINIPFVLKYDPKTSMLDLVSKTIMRKKNFLTPNKQFKV